MKINIFILALGTFLLSACSKNFMPYLERAETSYAQSKYVECVDAVQLGLPLWKDSDGEDSKARAYELLGKSYHHLKKIDKATDAFQRAVSISDNTYDSAYSLGIIYLASSEPQLAAKAFQDALRMKKDDPEALVGLGNAYYDQKKYKQAKQIYQRVIDTSPGVKDALQYIALVDKKLAASNKKSRRK
jgi:tetratricopeptide (TPR) repeat protein